MSLCKLDKKGAVGFSQTCTLYFHHILEVYKSICTPLCCWFSWPFREAPLKLFCFFSWLDQTDKWPLFATLKCSQSGVPFHLENSVKQSCYGINMPFSYYKTYTYAPIKPNVTPVYNSCPSHLPMLVWPSPTLWGSCLKWLALPYWLTYLASKPAWFVGWLPCVSVEKKKILSLALMDFDSLRTP